MRSHCLCLCLLISLIIRPGDLTGIELVKGLSHTGQKLSLLISTSKVCLILEYSIAVWGHHFKCHICWYQTLILIPSPCCFQVGRTVVNPVTCGLLVWSCSPCSMASSPFMIAYLKSSSVRSRLQSTPSQSEYLSCPCDIWWRFNQSNGIKLLWQQPQHIKKHTVCTVYTRFILL